ncbi:hypothetical protein AMJ49_03560 [Parcubacteria bacterium DG_74_2]|nr:MAG: hypothetical protein AMJ49_03560 [Parcubacteria bacterium DG_74_2]
MKEDKIMKKKSRAKLVINAGLIMAFLLLATPFILSSFSFFAGLVGFDYIFKPLAGKSMNPVLMHGDTVLVKKGAEDIQVGDIISFRVDSIPFGIVHRVVEIQKNPTLILKTKGDANNLPDQWDITADQVIGKVILIIPTSLLMTLYVLVPSISLPAILTLRKVVYRFSKKDAVIKKSEYRILNSTTALLLMILILAGGNLLSLILLTSV